MAIDINSNCFILKVNTWLGWAIVCRGITKRYWRRNVIMCLQISEKSESTELTYLSTWFTWPPVLRVNLKRRERNSELDWKNLDAPSAREERFTEKSSIIACFVLRSERNYGVYVIKKSIQPTVFTIIYGHIHINLLQFDRQSFKYSRFSDIYNIVPLLARVPQIQ